MIHELLGLDGNLTRMRGRPSLKKELQELVFSPAQDDFFRSLRYANFGDACNRIQALLQEYQRASKLNENLDSFGDIMAFIERYPAFRSQSVVATKHVTVMGEMSRMLDERKLMRQSELEQYLVCDGEGETEREYHLEEMVNLLSDPGIRQADKLRLAILFCLRYSVPASSNRLQRAHSEMVTRVRNCFMSEARASVEEMNTLDRTLDYARESMPPMVFGARNYGDDSESGGGLLGKIRTFASSLQGVSNVFTQHKPLVEKVLELYTKGRLRQSQFPSLSSSREESKQESKQEPTIQPTPNGTVVVFIIGGATFEEAYKLHELSQEHRSAPSSSSSSSSSEEQVNPSHTRILLGGSMLLNSEAFLEEVRK
jgi:vacuolar protein sorting-associated protein 45